ncbi:hypothetical protein, partial [Klebsiella sp. K6-243]|uniref:hypothetical protein n=1 Tax=Klebsiella sp. K6-243 TaxID=2927839 RepID=UPI0024DEC9AB
GLAAFTGKLTVGKSQLLAHPVTHSGFRLQHDDLTSRTYSHLPLILWVSNKEQTLGYFHWQHK